MKLNEEMTYKQLCEDFKLEPALNSGKKRKLQLEQLQQEYDIEKVGRGKYIIHKQYSTEEKELIQAEKNYNNFVQAAMLDMIANGDVQQVYTYASFRKQLYMVNENYFLYKYGKKELDIKAPSDFPEYYVEEFEDRWFNIAEEHDKYILKSNLAKLRERGLIEYTENYLLRKICVYGEGRIYEKSQLATLDQWSQIEQAKIDFMEDNNLSSIQNIFQRGPDMVKQYYDSINNKVKELGFDAYSKAFVVSRASELRRVVDFFTPKFNKAQVDRLLKSKRFGIIPRMIHEQMVDKTIKLTE